MAQSCLAVAPSVAAARFRDWSREPAAACGREDQWTVGNGCVDGIGERENDWCRVAGYFFFQVGGWVQAWWFGSKETARRR
jgi:hypothetical protein